MEVCSDYEDSEMKSEMGLEKLNELMSTPMKKGDYWYLIDKKWMELCKIFLKTKENVSHDESMNPGHIDNGALFKSTEGHVWELKERLQEDLDYVFLPEMGWTMLVETFGLPSENHKIRRPVIEQGHFNTYFICEVYPVELKLCLYGSKEEIIIKQFTRITILKDLEVEMRRLFKIDDNKETQLWANNDILNEFSETEKGKKNDNQTLHDASLHSGAIVTLEVRNHDSTWPSSRPRYGAIATRSSKCIPGLCGLMNLGNTCFMNSALQCMSNITPLTDYFVTDRYWPEVNAENPLGMRGEIAKSFADLIKAMWSGAHTCLAPREFKLAVGRFAPQFSGFQQQDCQELMAFLLDGLHEDLNRVKKKPYIDVKTDVEKRADQVVATESWQNYRKRNDSIIVDTFHGLLKSTLVCPECELISVTFDPFCYLSLPLPVKRERAIDVTFIPVSSKTSLTVSKLMVPKYGVISDISKAVAKVINESKELEDHFVEPDRLVIADVYNHRFHKLFSNDDTYTAQLDDIFVYETKEDCIPIPLYLREIKADESTPALFGRPMIINLNGDDYESLHGAVYEQLKKYVKVTGVEEDESDTDEGVAECEGTELFSLSQVNSFGSMEISKLDKNKPLKLNQKCYMSADFDTATKDKYIDWKEAEASVKVTTQRSVNSTGKTSIALNDCIGQFTTVETLGADDPWYCPRCKKHQQATKKFDVWSLPKVLIIHLKRFSYSRFWRDKLDTLVHFPLTDFNMGQYIINNPKNIEINYDLIAVANHYGGLGGGHYTAYGANRETGQWHFFDDSNVSPATEENVISKAAYVLFYIKKDQ